MNPPQPSHSIPETKQCHPPNLSAAPSGSPYCCQLSDGTIGCCWDPYIYQLWWFWFIWIIIFFLVLGCSLACWRRRRAQYRYVVMSNSEYPTYGTVVHASSARSMANPPAPAYTVGAYPHAQATAPVKPPSYATSEATKPPPYSG
ncbi:WW domain binding protein 1-like [Plakobranchus ocellatus]|uniref:WW domain binding protein 1-like n=1 Tax=Plakobranchus ocellatus TaxID=259542 RepID=A0AAV4C1K7_9GAST|nr:WW domain binding protein 1-like [Plakobranchus ocellatus]